MKNKLLKALSGKSNRYSTQDIRREFKLLNVENIHKFHFLVFMYKQQNSLLPDLFKDYFKLNRDVQVRFTRQENKLFIHYHLVLKP